MDPNKSKRMVGDEIPKDVRKDLWRDLSEDLPDGAALAMMDEFGLDVEDFDDK